MRYALLSLCLAACASGAVHPTRQHPILMCAISCGRDSHLLFTRQHICSGGGSRLFTDFIAVGERTERNVDGTILSDFWIGLDGDYPKSAVETMSCQSYISALIASRPADQRGQFPGEDPQGHPNK